MGPTLINAAPSALGCLILINHGLTAVARMKVEVRRAQIMSGMSGKIWALVALSLGAPPILLALALAGRSAELLIVGFLATTVTLFINSLLLVTLLVLWLIGVERVAVRKPITLIALLGTGVVADIVLLSLMPPLAK